jgi:hypothetical protein
VSLCVCVRRYAGFRNSNFNDSAGSQWTHVLEKRYRTLHTFTVAWTGRVIASSSGLQNKDLKPPPPTNKKVTTQHNPSTRAMKAKSVLVVRIILCVHYFYPFTHVLIKIRTRVNTGLVIVPSTSRRVVGKSDTDASSKIQVWVSEIKWTEQALLVLVSRMPFICLGRLL